MLQWYQITKATGRILATGKLPSTGLAATKIKTRQPWQQTYHSVLISHLPQPAAIKSDFINAYKDSRKTRKYSVTEVVLIFIHF